MKGDPENVQGESVKRGKRVKELHETCGPKDNQVEIIIDRIYYNDEIQRLRRVGETTLGLITTDTERN